MVTSCTNAKATGDHLGCGGSSWHSHSIRRDDVATDEAQPAVSRANCGLDAVCVGCGGEGRFPFLVRGDRWPILCAWKVLHSCHEKDFLHSPASDGVCELGVRCRTPSPPPPPSPRGHSPARIRRISACGSKCAGAEIVRLDIYSFSPTGSGLRDRAGFVS